MDHALSFYSAQIYASIPLAALCLWILFGGGATKEARRAAATAAAKGPAREDALPKLTTLRCGACGAAVPLEEHRFPCPHCAAEVSPPSEWAATLTARSAAAEARRRAERTWRALGMISSRPIPEAIALSSVAWWVLTVISGPHDRSRENLTIGVATLWGFFILLLAWLLWDARSDLPRPMNDAPLVGAAEVVACKQCGAPVRFVAGQLSTTCGYCGSEEYRVAVVARARAAASASEERSTASFVAYVQRFYDTRDVILTLFLLFVALPMLLIVLYAVLRPVLGPVFGFLDLFT